MELYTCKHEYTYNGTEIETIDTLCETSAVSQDYLDTFVLTSLFTMTIIVLYLLINIFKPNK